MSLNIPLLTTNKNNMSDLLFCWIKKTTKYQDQDIVKIQAALTSLCQLRNQNIQTFQLSKFNEKSVNALQKIQLYIKFGDLLIQKIGWNFSWQKLSQPLIFKWKGFFFQKQNFQTDLLKDDLEFFNLNLGILYLIKASQQSHCVLSKTQKYVNKVINDSKIAYYKLFNAMKYSKANQIKQNENNIFLMGILLVIAKGIYYQNYGLLYQQPINQQNCLKSAASYSEAYKTFNFSEQKLNQILLKKKQIFLKKQSDVFCLRSFIYLNRALCQVKSYQRFFHYHQILHDQTKNIQKLQHIVGYLKKGLVRLKVDLQSQIGKQYFQSQQAKDYHNQLKKYQIWFSKNLKDFQAKNKEYGTKNNEIQLQKISIDLTKEVLQEIELKDSTSNFDQQIQNNNEQYKKILQNLEGISLIKKISYSIYVQNKHNEKQSLNPENYTSFQSKQTSQQCEICNDCKLI